jgi:dethiobiotin synthetase
MSKGIFITATGTDVGKTYVSALLLKKLRQAGHNAGYYKAALSGAANIKESDAGYVCNIADIKPGDMPLLSYLYHHPVSPHLAAKLEGNPVELKKVLKDYELVKTHYEYVVVEGSGGIVCPLRYEENNHIFLEDIIKALDLNTIIVADAGLGVINAVVLTIEYLKKRNIGICGIILNRYTGGVMQKDNIKMIESITHVPVIALIAPDDSDLQIDMSILTSILKEDFK